MARTPRRKKYSDVLSKPMKRSVSAERLRSIVPISDDEVVEGMAHKRLVFVERMVALADHYGVDLNTKDAGWRLAYALAREHVPGFREEGGETRAANAPRKWMDVDRLTLWLSVQALREEGMTVEEALTVIFGNVTARERLPSVSSVSSLRRQYRDSGPTKCEMTATFEKLLAAAGAPARSLALAYVPALGEILAAAEKDKK